MRGRRFPTEAVQVSPTLGFDRLDLTAIVAFTAVDNAPSRRVMEKLGMSHDSADDFDQRCIEVGHPLRRHVLSRTRRLPTVPLCSPTS
jgi:RimJ/RimL family protein N-acetyltransferase